jgi:hypothetical protein
MQGRTKWERRTVEVLHVVAELCQHKMVRIDIVTLGLKINFESMIRGMGTYYLNAENFIDNQTRFPSPPLSMLSTQIGHKPILVVPIPLMKRGV